MRRRLANKRALQKRLGLPLEPRVPLVGIVSRLDTQKGFDLAEPALRRILAEVAGQAGFDYTVSVLPISVIALATTDWVAAIT